MKNIIIVFFFLLLFSGSVKAQELETIGTQKPFEISGAFTIFNSYYHVDGIDPRRKDYTWYFTGTPLIKIYGVEIPLSFTVSEQERSFRQPFNQFCISPSYKWVKAHIGYTNLTWSPFTWSGQTAMGAAIELNPGKFRFGMLYGRLNRAVEENLISPEVQTPAYKRMGYAARIGYGTESSHVDFIVLKAKDDEASLKSIPQNTDVLPGENLVAGLSSKMKFSQHLFWDADVATSIYTRDLRALPLSDDSNSIVNSFRSFLTVNTSSSMYNSYQTELRYEDKTYKIKAKYRRVEPDFQSMGAYYFQTDVENITIEPSLYLMKNKLKLLASFGHQRDNLLNKKSYTTKRIIGNLGFDWNISKVFGLNALYANYSGEQNKGLKIPNQATQQSFVSQNMIVMPRLTFVKQKITHFHTIVANRQWLTDRNPNTADLTEYQVNNLNYNSSIIINNSGLTFGINYLLSTFDSNANYNRLDGVGINLSKPFFKNKMMTALTANGTKQKLNHEPYADILNFSLVNTFKFNQHHGLTLTGVYIDNKSKIPAGITFNEYNIDLGYTYTF